MEAMFLRNVGFGVTSQKAVLFIATSVKTSNSTLA
jgi:hypothetical protein